MMWGAVALFFLAGLVCRIEALDLRPAAAREGVPVNRWAAAEALSFLENDEKIYTALVEQLDRGKGYTLRGHPILNEPWINHEQYDHPLFFHQTLAGPANSRLRTADAMAAIENGGSFLRLS